MKKILFIACLLAATFCAQAQTSSFVVRSGNTYSVDGQSMNKQGFMNYLQSHDQVIYQDFSKAYKLSNVGWGLFGSGLGLETIGFGIMMGEAIKTGVDASKEKEINPAEITAGMTIGYLMCFIGGALDLSGIVCLGVGYGRMHKAADIYNVQVQQKYKAQLSFTGNGLALAW